MISILSPVFRDIVIDEIPRKVSKNATIYSSSKTEYGGVIQLQKNFRARVDISWFYVASGSQIALAENFTNPPKNASEITAIIYLKGHQKKTHILNMPSTLKKWDGPKQAGELLHVMYAEYFEKLNFLKLRKKFNLLTVDFCGLDHIFTKQNLIQFVSAFDYIFCSEHDEWANSVEKLKNISIRANALGSRKPVFIYHTPRYVRVCSDGEITLIKNDHHRPGGVGKVVGNGDLFAYLLLKKIKGIPTFNELKNIVKIVQKDFLNYA